MKFLAPAIRIPNTPRDLLHVAALLDRLRVDVESRGETWPPLEEELRAREQLLQDRGR